MRIYDIRIIMKKIINAFILQKCIYLYFFSRASVPPNTHSAITPTFYTYNPPTRGNYSSFYIAKPEYMVNLLIPEQDVTRQINSQEKAFEEEIKEFKREKDEKERERQVLTSEHRNFQVNIINNFDCFHTQL